MPRVNLDKGNWPRSPIEPAPKRRGGRLAAGLFATILLAPFLALVAIATIWLCAWLVVHFPA